MALNSGVEMPYASTGPVPPVMLTGHLVMSSGHSCGSIEAGCSHTLQQQEAKITHRIDIPQYTTLSLRPRLHSHRSLLSLAGVVTHYIRSAKAVLIKATACFQRAEFMASAQRQPSESRQPPSNILEAAWLLSRWTQPQTWALSWSQPCASPW